MVTVWWSTAHLVHYSFLNPRENITSEKYEQQIDEMHWKLQCLQPAMLHRKGPILLHDNNRSHFTQPMLQKSNNFGYKVLPHLSYSPDLSPHSYHFFKHLSNFCWDAPTTAWHRLFPRVHWIPVHGFLRYRNIQTFLLGKKVLIVIVLILINKDVFEPSYSDLNFTVKIAIMFAPT